MKKRIMVLVMGIPFEVQYVKKVDEDHNAGETNGSTRTIKISTVQNPTESLRHSTLVHEYLHALLYVTGQSEHLEEKEEEALVLALEHGLADKMSIELYEEVDE